MGPHRRNHPQAYRDLGESRDCPHRRRRTGGQAGKGLADQHVRLPDCQGAELLRAAALQGWRRHRCCRCHRPAEPAPGRKAAGPRTAADQPRLSTTRRPGRASPRSGAHSPRTPRSPSSSCACPTAWPINGRRTWPTHCCACALPQRLQWSIAFANCRANATAGGVASRRRARRHPSSRLSPSHAHVQAATSGGRRTMKYRATTTTLVRAEPSQDAQATGSIEKNIELEGTPNREGTWILAERPVAGWVDKADCEEARDAREPVQRDGFVQRCVIAEWTFNAAEGVAPWLVVADYLIARAIIATGIANAGANRQLGCRRPAARDECRMGRLSPAWRRARGRLRAAQTGIIRSARLHGAAFRMHRDARRLSELRVAAGADPGQRSVHTHAARRVPCLSDRQPRSGSRHPGRSCPRARPLHRSGSRAAVGFASPRSTHASGSSRRQGRPNRCRAVRGRRASRARCSIGAGRARDPGAHAGSRSACRRKQRCAVARCRQGRQGARASTSATRGARAPSSTISMPPIFTRSRPRSRRPGAAHSLRIA